MDVIALLELRDGCLRHAHITDQRRLGVFHM